MKMWYNGYVDILPSKFEIKVKKVRLLQDVPFFR